MSTVTTRAPASLAVPPIVWVHADAVLLAEDRAAHQAAGPLRSQLRQLLATFTLRWRRDLGPLKTEQSGREFRAFARDLAIALDRVTPGTTTAITATAVQAQVLGQQQAYAELGIEASALAATELSQSTADFAAAALDRATGKLRKAAALTRTYRQGSFVVARNVLAVAETGANDLEQAARTLTNEGVRDGATAVADDVGAQLLWIAERDACVTCLALSGHLADERGEFDVHATFGRSPIAWLPDGGLIGPPRHPNCRCRLTPWIEHDVQPVIPRQRGSGITDPNLPEALRREAERSVLNGWALPSEPTTVRAQAAARLLDRITDGLAPSGWQVPKSVRSGATKDLKAGKFRKRVFPK